MAVEIGVEVLRDLLAGGKMHTILDVREPDETLLAPFVGALEIPMGEIPSRLEELGREDEIVVLCHHGIRSGRIAGYLEQQGFSHISNLTGGIDAWSLFIDPKVPRY
jgi:rhodanese-related sulfurtransferase